MQRGGGAACKVSGVSEFRFVIRGRPITKKNHQRIVVNRRTGKPMVIPSKPYKEYEQAALWQLKTQRIPTITEAVNVCARYWMPDRRSRPDLLGLKQATADILEAAGIVENDRLIAGWDGSRIMGIDRDNPRAEIIVTLMEVSAS